MPVKIKSTLGSVTLAAENVSGDTTLTVPSGTGTVATTTQVNRMGGRKNLIINGAMQVWQRGTSFSASGGYGADRWWWSTADTISVNKTTFTEQQNAISIAKSTTVDPCYLAQSVEDVRTAAGQDVTISFYAKADAGTTLKVFGFQLFGTGGSSTVDLTSQTDTLTTEWTKYSFTFAIPSVEGKSIGTNSNLRMSIQFGTDNTWTGTGYLAQVQLELGDTATDFEHRSYGEELALCQRYYQYVAANGGGVRVFQGYMENSTKGRFDWAHPVVMRTAPTMTRTSGIQVYMGGSALGWSWAGWTTAEGSCMGAFEVGTTNLGTQYYGCHLRYNGTADRMELDAEL